MDADKLVRLVEDYVSLKGAERKLDTDLGQSFSSETLLASAKVAKQLWGVQYKLYTVPSEARDKVMTTKSEALAKIYQASLKSGKRISRTKTTSPKAKAKTAKSKGLSFMS